MTKNSLTNTAVFQPQSILVTGGAGFIGANFLHYLANNTAFKATTKVVNLDKMTYAANPAYLADLALENYQLVEGSINDHALLKRLFSEHDFDCVVHFAAESHVDRSIAGPEVFVETNVLGTVALLEAAKQYWQEQGKCQAGLVRFHHISTDEVFGSLSMTDPAFCETTPYDPNSPYSGSKAASDHLVRAWHHTYDLPVTMSNCSNNYGEGQHAEKLIPTVIRHALQGHKIPVYGDGKNRRDWLYVMDHCQAIWQIVQHGVNGETYVVGGGSELSNNEIVEEICQILDVKRPQQAPHRQLIEYVTDRAGHDFRYAINASKIEQDLGWRPQHDLSDGLLRTVEYVIKQHQD